MQTIVLIKKNGTVSEKRVKSFTFDQLYKYGGMKSETGFEHLHTWKIKKGRYVNIFGKREGRSNNINKMELPPPIDTPIFYGTLCVVETNEKTVSDVSSVESYSVEKWNKDYEKLFGGFEDIGAEDSYESDELENYPKEAITKEGYLKDGFIVENEDDEDEDNDIDSHAETSESEESAAHDDDDDDEESVEYDETGSDEENDSQECANQSDEESEYESDDDNSGSELEEEDYDSDDEQ